MVATGDTYSYDRFRPSNYEPGTFAGPKAGDTMSYDYTFSDLDGAPVALRDYEEKWLVVESGSLTCPMYVKNVKPFVDVRAKHPDVEWLVIYIREAHPGNKLKQPTSIAEKIAYAKRSRDEYHEARTIVVDDLEGSWHHDFGLWPNSVWVINPEGTVIYRADWSMADRVDHALSHRDEINTEDHVLHLGASPWIAVPVTLKAGWLGLWDLVKIAPQGYFRFAKQKLANRRINHNGSENQ